MAFARIASWIWGRKDAETLDPSGRSSHGGGFSEPEHLKFPLADERRMRSSSRRLWRKWQSREERRVDKEYDAVLVPSDGECMSGSESDDSDWSIGWSEPHDPAFHNASEAENSFAVLVPCYRRRRADGRAEGSECSPLGLLRSDDDDAPGERLGFVSCKEFTSFTCLALLPCY